VGYEGGNRGRESEGERERELVGKKKKKERKNVRETGIRYKAEKKRKVDQR
jgi:hypothetical protein